MILARILALHLTEHMMANMSAVKLAQPSSRQCFRTLCRLTEAKFTDTNRRNGVGGGVAALGEVGQRETTVKNKLEILED